MVDIRNPGRIRRSMLRQFASSPRRRPVPPAHQLAAKISTLPEQLTAASLQESIDTPENRFIKHVLDTFLAFVTHVKDRMNSASRAYREAVTCEQFLDETLGHALYADDEGDRFFHIFHSSTLEYSEREALEARLEPMGMFLAKHR